jgi:uncharacterized membrane protein YbhN (UPF0104 family)
LGTATDIRPAALGLSIILWVLSAGALYAAARAVGTPVRPSDIWLLVSFQLPLQALPVQGIGNAGSHELSWIAALQLLNVSREEALRFALASHLVLIAYVVTLAAVGTTVLIVTKSRPSLRAPFGVPGERAADSLP